MGIRISIDGGGDIVIKRKKRDKKPASKQSQVTDQSSSTSRRVTLTFSKSILDQMEIRTEGVFRPQMQDAETAYGISGDETLDMFHKFTSREVIRESTPSSIYTTTDKKIEHILEERGENPGIVVDAHTHPSGIAELSEEDRSTMKRIYQLFKEKLPDTKMFFGVHAISEEMELSKRIGPEVSGNRIRWKSLTREHEVAFFDENSKPVSVMIREP